MSFQFHMVVSVLSVALSLLSVPVLADVPIETGIVHLRMEGYRQSKSAVAALVQSIKDQVAFS